MNFSTIAAIVVFTITSLLILPATGGAYGHSPKETKDANNHEHDHVPADVAAAPPVPTVPRTPSAKTAPSADSEPGKAAKDAAEKVETESP